MASEKTTRKTGESDVVTSGPGERETTVGLAVSILIVALVGAEMLPDRSRTRAQSSRGPSAAGKLHSVTGM